jgi:hypothetical protein
MADRDENLYLSPLPSPLPKGEGVSGDSSNYLYKKQQPVRYPALLLKHRSARPIVWPGRGYYSNCMYSNIIQYLLVRI